MDEGNKDKNEVALRIYKGESKAHEEIISGDKRESVTEKRLGIKGEESLYFVPYAACTEGGQLIRWNVKIKYEQIEPFSDMAERISWRLDKQTGEREGALEVIREQDEWGRIKIREDWYSVLSRGVNGSDVNEKKASEYMVRGRKFIPIIIDKEGMEAVLKASGYESAERQNELKALISSMYIYEIVNERYVLFDEQVKAHKLYYGQEQLSEKEQRLMQVLRALSEREIREVIRYRNKYIKGEAAKRLFLDKSFCQGREWARDWAEKKREVGVGRIGYVDEKGRIYLDRLNGKDLTAVGREIYLGEEKIGTAEIGEGYRKKKIGFKIRGDGSTLEYEAEAYEPKGFKIGVDEIERITAVRGRSGEYREEQERWSSISRIEYERLIRVAGREGGGKGFIEGIYRRNEKRYELQRRKLGAEEKERLNKLLKSYETEEFAEEEGYAYNEAERVYELKDREYVRLVSEEELEKLRVAEREKEIRRYERLQEGAQNTLLGRYGQIKRVMKYGAQDRYKVKEAGGEGYIRINVIEGDRLNHIDVWIEQWDSGKDYSNEDKKDELFTYETESEQEAVVGVEEKDGQLIEKKEKRKIKSRQYTAARELLSGGNKQWFYGIWIKDQRKEEYAFSEKKLKPDVSRINQEAVEREVKEKNADRKKTMEEMSDNNQLSYYIMTANNKKKKEEYSVIRKEDESGEALDEQYYVGNINRFLTEDKTGLYTYTPFLYRDTIYSNRVAGSKYYRIPGIVEQKITGLPVIKSSISKSKEHAFSSLFNFEKNETLEKFSAERFIKNFFSKVSNFIEKIIRRLLSNISYGWSEGSSGTGIILTDIDGNGTADIVVNGFDTVSVNLNKEKEFGKGYNIANLNKLTETKDRVDTYGSGLSRSGAVSKEYDSDHNLLTVRPSASVSISEGISVSYGRSADELAFMDINGDGLPDSINIDAAYLNTGDSVNRISGFVCPLEKRKTYSIASSVNAGGDLAAEAKMQRISVNASGAIGYSGSYNETVQRFINLRGSLTDSIAGEKDEVVLAINTGNKFSDKKLKVKLPEWDISLQNKTNLFFVADGNVFFSFFSNLPGLKNVLSKKQDAAFAKDGLSLNPLSPVLLFKINTIGISSSVSLSGNIGGGLSATPAIPVGSVAINIPFNGGAGVNAAGNINGVSVSMLDMDGDGLADRVLRIPGRNGAVYVQRNLLGKVGLLKKIKLPQGGSYELKYKREGNTVELPHCKYVLSEVTARSGLKTKTGNEQAYTTYYTYEDGYYNRIEKEFYGFKTVRSKNAIGTVTETEYYTDSYYRKGMVKKETVKNGNRVYSIKEYEIDTAPHARIKKEVNTVREGYNEIKTESEYEYDRYGNVTKLYDKGDVTNTNDDIIAEITYWKGGNEGAYFKAHPEKIQVLHGKTGTLLRKREGVYDSRTGALTELKQYTSNSSYLVHRIEWTDEGNIKALTGPTGKRSEYKYLDGIYPIEIKEISSKGEAPYISEIEWDSVLGVKLKETDGANNTMTYRYDNFGRVTEVRSPYDTGETPYARYEYHTPADSFWYTVTVSRKV